MKNVLEYLENSAAVWPDKSGVTDEKGTYTFREVYKKSRSIASALAHDVNPRQAAAVFMPKGKDALISFLGIVYAGGFYSYFDPELPMSRLGMVAAVLKPSVILTDREHMEEARTHFSGIPCFSIEQLMQSCEDAEYLERVRRQQVDVDPLYVNFTSGSTGKPKGVVVSHRSVIDFIDAFSRTFSLDSRECIANQAPFDFDVSVKDIYTALKTGAELVIVPRELFSRPAELLDYLCEHEVTTMIWAVSALCLVSMFHGLDYRCPDTVRKVMFSGEVMPKKQLKDWMEHLPEAMFVNLYGPTEITCNCTYYVLDPGKEYGLEEVIPAGTAFENEKVFLLDEENQEVDPSDLSGEGEICVGGTCVALGYYRDPERTAAAFVQNPLNDRYPERIYRTGDIGRYDADGNLVYVSRKDFQIKHLGHRIELGEVEADTMARDGVSRACCIYDAKKKRLILFYTGERDKKDLEKELKEILPPFMVPNKTIQLEEMPLNKNGKIDRHALEAIYQKPSGK